MNSNNFRKENLRTLRTSILQVPKVTQRPSFHSGFNTSHTSLGACKSGVRKLRSGTKEVLVLGSHGVIGSMYTCVNSESHSLKLLDYYRESSTYTCVDSES